MAVLHPDVNHSRGACTLEHNGSPLEIRPGLRTTHGLGGAGQARVVERRGNWPFQGLRDFCRRTRLLRSVAENLIRAGAMDSFGRKRRDLLWELGGLEYHEEGLGVEVPIEPVALPTLDRAERLGWEVELLGMTPGDHVMDLYREALRTRGVLSTGELAAQRDGQTVRAAGRVVVRQRPPTAKGVVFVTLEDEDGLVNLVVRPGVYERYRGVLRNAPLLLVEGRLQREGSTFSVLVHSATPLR